MKNQTYKEIKLDKLTPNPYNPRKNYFGDRFEELVASIEKKGVLEPILVRSLSDDKYEIVAGERRYRALCRIAESNGGLNHVSIPAVIKTLSDDEAFEVMTIENLQREGLTELEEARSFKIWIDRKGADSIQDLADRIGIKAHYIRRRIATLELPDAVLDAWEQGKIKYGHCEQLCRIKGKKLALEYLKEILLPNSDLKVISHLKNHIDRQSIGLKHAEFDLQKAGCTTCNHNSDVQESLFLEAANIGNTSCLDPACFKKHQNNHLLANWDKKYKKKYKTNGFRFYDQYSCSNRIRYNGFTDQKNGYYGEKKPAEKCSECESYVTLFEPSGKLYRRHACIGDEKCYRAIREKKEPATKSNTGSNNSETTNDSEDAPRVSWHGQHFREEFYKTRIPELVNDLPSDNEKVLRILLLSILESNGIAAEFFHKKYIQKNKDEIGWFSREAFWPIIELLQGPELQNILHQVSLLILMDERSTTARTRHRVAVHLGSDLASEWRITQEYLDKKTIKEMLIIGKKTSLFDDPKAQTFLYENLGKKRGKFESCNKKQLIAVFLESGVDLAGKVPDEILSIDNPTDDEFEDGEERTCRVCGCTEDNACEGGCSWVEEDLCSACVGKE